MRKSFGNFFQDLRQGWAGLHIVLGVAIASRFLHGLLPDSLVSKSISEILLAVLLGLYLRNWVGIGERALAGVRFSIQRILRLGIILLGLRLSLQDVAATGFTALVLVIICISLALSLAVLLGRLFHVPPRLAALIGVGTAICGNTAIIATAPVLEADEEEVSFAVATITIFGLLAVLLYPLIGRLIGLDQHLFGLWAGTAVNDTSQVVAVGAIYGDAALDVATIVKLTRNTLMAPLIVLIGLINAFGAEKRGEGGARTKIQWGKMVPGFVIGFLLMSLLRTLGIALDVLPQDVAEPGTLQTAALVLKGFDQAAKFAILMAMAGVGLNTDLSKLKKLGIKPLLIGTFVAALLAVISLVLILYTPLGKI